MRLRSIRSRVLILITLPLLSLIGVYAYATALSASSAITLARATAIRNSVNDPIGLFIAQIQAERLQSTTYLAHPSPQTLGEFTGQEGKTNRFLSALRAAANSRGARSNSSPQVKADLGVLVTDTAALPALRQRVSSRTIGIAKAQSEYTAIVTTGYETITQTIFEMPNAQLETQALAVLKMGQGAEILLQEQALFAGDIMTGSFPSSAHQKFAVLVGEQRGLVAEALSGLDPVYQSYYRRYVNPDASVSLTKLENAVINTPAGVVPKVPPLTFEKDAGAVAGGLGTAGFRSGLVLANYGQQVARPVYLRLILAGGLGLFAIIVSIITSIGIGRGLVRELGGLKEAALDLAHVRLPLLVARLSAGEDVAETAGELPFPNPSRDEIGQVRQSFNTVQRTAIEAAVGQARLRAGIAVVFRNLAGRSQSLLHRQLAMLDDLESRTDDPSELDALFQIDHLTTRLRRHAEGLVVLAGDRPGRVWNKPVPLADVLRAAVAEVEGYHRVKVITKSRSALAGRAVAEVIHLIAELVENAVLFSPLNTPVRVVGDLVAHGFAVEIEDRGLGMTEAAMAEFNAKLADPPEMDPATTDQLGLYVTARLARQHGIRVTLRASAFSGTTAIVVIPQDLVVSEGSYAADTDAGLANELAIRATGRHAVRSVLGPQYPAGPGGASNGHLGQEAPQNGAASAVTIPEQVGPVEPFLCRTPDAGGRELETAEEPQATDGSTVGPELPRRVPQASLAPELRDPQPEGTAGNGGGSPGERSPGEARDAFTTLQRGWERDRADAAATWPGATASPPGDRPWPGPDEDGGAPASGTSGREGTQ
jgi:signal transduction histidine kinase